MSFKPDRVRQPCICVLVLFLSLHSQPNIIFLCVKKMCSGRYFNLGKSYYIYEAVKPRKGKSHMTQKSWVLRRLTISSEGQRIVILYAALLSGKNVLLSIFCRTECHVRVSSLSIVTSQLCISVSYKPSLTSPVSSWRCHVSIQYSPLCCHFTPTCTCLCACVTNTHISNQTQQYSLLQVLSEARRNYQRRLKASIVF